MSSYPASVGHIYLGLGPHSRAFTGNIHFNSVCVHVRACVYVCGSEGATLISLPAVKPPPEQFDRERLAHFSHKLAGKSVASSKQSKGRNGYLWECSRTQP